MWQGGGGGELPQFSESQLLCLEWPHTGLGTKLAPNVTKYELNRLTLHKVYETMYGLLNK